MIPPLFPAIATQLPTFTAKFGFEVFQKMFLFPERYVVQILILSAVFIALPLIAVAYGVKKLYERHFPQ